MLLVTRFDSHNYLDRILGLGLLVIHFNCQVWFNFKHTYIIALLSHIVCLSNLILDEIKFMNIY